MAHHLSPQEGPGQNGQASAGRGRRQAASCGVRHAQAPAALQPLTSPRRARDDWVLTYHGMSRWRMAGGSVADLLDCGSAAGSDAGSAVISGRLRHSYPEIMGGTVVAASLGSG